MNYLIILLVIAIIGFGSCIYIYVHDANINSQNIVKGLPCTWIKGGIIDLQKDLIFKDSRYDHAVEKWNSDECKEERESMN